MQWGSRGRYLRVVWWCIVVQWPHLEAWWEYIQISLRHAHAKGVFDWHVHVCTLCLLANHCLSFPVWLHISDVSFPYCHCLPQQLISIVFQGCAIKDLQVCLWVVLSDKRVCTANTSLVTTTSTRFYHCHCWASPTSSSLSASRKAITRLLHWAKHYHDGRRWGRDAKEFSVSRNKSTCILSLK